MKSVGASLLRLPLQLQAFDPEVDVGAYCQQVYILKSCVGLAHTVKSKEATWLQTQLAGLELK